MKKSMKRTLVLVTILVIAIPQVALAAWWNPFSWKIFSKVFSRQSTPAQVEQVPGINDEIDVQDKALEIEKLREEIEILKNKAPSINQEKDQRVVLQTTKPSMQENTPHFPVIPVQQTSSATVIKDSSALYDDLLQKYTDFKSFLENERRSLDKNSQYISEREYFKYIDGLLTRTSADLGYLHSIQYWNPRPMNIENVYLAKFNVLKTEYAKESNIYPIELEQDKMRTAKKNVVDYIKNNKQILYQSDIHIKAAALLYIFDQLFNTKYSPDFESKKTQQENIEFANRFLIDRGESITD
jgi:hypothetical protein